MWWRPVFVVRPSVQVFELTEQKGTAVRGIVLRRSVGVKEWTGIVHFLPRSNYTVSLPRENATTGSAPVRTSFLTSKAGKYDYWHTRTQRSCLGKRYLPHDGISSLVRKGVEQSLVRSYSGSSCISEGKLQHLSAIAVLHPQCRLHQKSICLWSGASAALLPSKKETPLCRQHLKYI